MRRILRGTAMCVLGVLALPGVAAAQVTTPSDPAPDPSAAPPPVPTTSQTSVVGGGRTTIGNITFSLDLGAATVAGDPAGTGAARGTIRFDQDVQGPGRSRSSLTALVRCLSVTGKQATVVGEVTGGTGAFHNTQRITLYIEDNGPPVVGGPVDRFGSDVGDSPPAPTCTPAVPAAQPDLGGSLTEGGFVIGGASAPTAPAPAAPDATAPDATTPGATDAPDSSRPSGGGAVRSP